MLSKGVFGVCNILGHLVVGFCRFWGIPCSCIFLDLQAQFGSLIMTCLICKGGSVAYILVFLTFLYS